MHSLGIVAATLCCAAAVQAQLPQFRPAPERAFPRGDGETVAIGDLNGDGWPDVVSVWQTYATLYLNDGTGRFASRLLGDPSPGFWSSAALGDIDGDGDQDMLVGRFFGDPLLFENDGHGAFTSVPFSPTATSAARAVALVDVDGDGDRDAIVGGEPLEVHLNDGLGGFTEDPGAAPDIRAFFFRVADLEPDGDPDLVTIPARADSNLLVNDGTGRFRTAPERLPLVLGVHSIAAGDVDGDGHLDLYLGRGTSGPARLMLQGANGVFADVSATHLPADPTSWVEDAPCFGDLDLDGDLDLYVGRNGLLLPAPDRLLLNRGDGTFSEAPASRLPGALDTTTDARLVDIDRDGDLDVVLGARAAGIDTRLLINHHVQVSALLPPTRAQPFELRFDHRPGYAPRFAVMVPVLGVRGAAVSLPPFGRWHLATAPTIDLAPVYLPPFEGSATRSIPVPDDPTLVGLELGVQAALIDPLAPARLTNACLEVVR